ncbi:hypothetical protein GOBAR_AA28574 [Gossypium barbadense]|uniref:Uncharacterized protein n=1 Tax=Gossypium barbadense TaxID=3634 RepID=A0A2P5WLZ2_GOSBA|nr:hypothetical protein GOBAR_AA28574 [Gossypium barbadense]
MVENITINVTSTGVKSLGPRNKVIIGSNVDSILAHNQRSQYVDFDEEMGVEGEDRLIVQMDRLKQPRTQLAKSGVSSNMVSNMEKFLYRQTLLGRPVGRNETLKLERPGFGEPSDNSSLLACVERSKPLCNFFS